MKTLGGSTHENLALSTKKLQDRERERERRDVVDQKIPKRYQSITMNRL